MAERKMTLECLAVVLGFIAAVPSDLSQGERPYPLVSVKTVSNIQQSLSQGITQPNETKSQSREVKRKRELKVKRKRELK